MSRGGVIRLLDQIKIQSFPNFKSWQILATQHKSSNQPTHANLRVQQRNVRQLHMKVKGRSLEGANAIQTRRFLAWFRQVVLSYIHVDGDFNPRRVTVARVHGGLLPRRVHEEATLSIPPWPSPTKDLPHQRQIFTKQAISLPLQTPWFNSTILLEAPK